MTKLSSAGIGFLYQRFLKKIFFLWDAETIHNFLTATGKVLGSNLITQQLTEWVFAYHSPRLSKVINGITFPNPVGLAAGFDYNGQLTQILPQVGFGFQTVGTVTLNPYPGNPKPRLGRFPNSQALLVNKGLKTKGAYQIIRNLEKIGKFSYPLGISIASTNQHFESLRDQLVDFMSCFYLFEKSKVCHAYYELNISCPNTFGGEPFTTPARLEVLLCCLDRLKLHRPVYIKMPIDQSEKETLQLLKVADQHQIAGVVIGNLTKDKHNPAVQSADREVWQHKAGNLSGKPTWERSNRLIKLTKKHFKNRFTIIGTGGVFNGENAVTKMEMGADLVQLITGMIFQGPQVIGQINYILDHQRS